MSPPHIEDKSGNINLFPIGICLVGVKFPSLKPQVGTVVEIVG